MGNIFDYINCDKQKNNKKETKEFKNLGNNSFSSTKNSCSSYEELNSKFGKENVDFAINNYNKYKDYSQDELINTLYQNIQNSKKNGTFNYTQIKNSIDAITPMLSSEQQILLQKLLKEIQ